MEAFERALPASDYRPTARKQLQYQDHQRQQKEQMNKPTQGIAAHDTHQPQNEKNYKDCPEHLPPPRRSNFLIQLLNANRLDARLAAKGCLAMQESQVRFFR